MGIVGIAAAVVAVTLVILAAFMIPAFIEMRKTAAELRKFIANTDSELNSVMKELRLALDDLKTVTGGMADKVDNVKSFMDAVGDTGRNLSTINSVIGVVAGVCSSSSVWMTGAKAAGRMIAEKLIRKRG